MTYLSFSNTVRPHLSNSNECNVRVEGNEGHNLAIIYNVSDTGDCDQGLLCILQQLGPAVMGGFDAALQGELQLLAKHSLEEFDVLRPTIRERYNQVARDMKTWLETRGQCGQCIRYLSTCYKA